MSVCFGPFLKMIDFSLSRKKKKIIWPFPRKGQSFFNSDNDSTTLNKKKCVTYDGSAEETNVLTVWKWRVTFVESLPPLTRSAAEEMAGMAEWGWPASSDTLHLLEDSISVWDYSAVMALKTKQHARPFSCFWSLVTIHCEGPLWSADIWASKNISWSFFLALLALFSGM